MMKLFGPLLCISFLLFHSTLIADESMEIEEQIPSEEVLQEEVIIPEERATDDTHPDVSHENEEAQTVEPQTTEQEEISEAQREANAAEEAELREVGIGEEPIVE